MGAGLVCISRMDSTRSFEIEATQGWPYSFKGSTFQCRMRGFVEGVYIPSFSLFLAQFFNLTISFRSNVSNSTKPFGFS